MKLGLIQNKNSYTLQAVAYFAFKLILSCFFAQRNTFTTEDFEISTIHAFNMK